MIGVIGDHNPKNPTHVATGPALEGLELEFEWVATDTVHERWAEIEKLSGVFVAPASPYRDMEAVLDVIRNARQRGVPLVGT
jgi:CTP synthase (UTP-ammonia lyase)